jgi:hypothetical protein
VEEGKKGNQRPKEIMKLKNWRDSSIHDLKYITNQRPKGTKDKGQRPKALTCQ